MHLTTKRLRFAVPLLVLAVAFVVAPVPANSTTRDPGALFTINHYKVYDVFETVVVDQSFILQDQFGTTTHNAIELDLFALPVDKNFEGIPDPIAHLTWWRLLDGFFSPVRDVVVTNQFGQFGLGVFDAEYLLTPALKNQGTGAPPPDFLDHYKCYKVEGNEIAKSITLGDQFVGDTTFVMAPAYLCNPVKKELPGGVVFPIRNPTEHLVCYDITGSDLSGIELLATDQFHIGPLNIGETRYLCVPSEKEEVVQVEEGTWGKIKSIYR